MAEKTAAQPSLIFFYIYFLNKYSLSLWLSTAKYLFIKFSVPHFSS